MTEHRCVTCSVLRPGEPRIYERANVCDGCRSRLVAIPREIGTLYVRLDEELLPGQGNGQRVSGSREAPLPLRVDPLDLSMPAPSGRRRWSSMAQRSQYSLPTPASHLDDQIGQPSVASVLDSWVRDWREVRDRGERLPEPTVAVLVTWLVDRTEWAADEHPAVDEYAAEMVDLLRVLRRTVGVSEVRPEHLDVPCRRCDLLDLHRLPGEDRVECGSCGDLLTEEEYRRWCGLEVAGLVHEGDLVSGAEAAVRLGVGESTVRTWVMRGWLEAAGTHERRTYYRWADLLQAELRARRGVVVDVGS